MSSQSWNCRYCMQLNAEYATACGRCDKPRAPRLPRTITIVIRDGNDFDIHEGECLTTRLGWDEFLGSIAVITHPVLSKIQPVPPYSRMQHIDDYITGRQRYWSRAAPPPTDMTEEPE